MTKRSPPVLVPCHLGQNWSLADDLKFTIVNYYCKLLIITDSKSKISIKSCTVYVYSTVTPDANFTTTPYMIFQIAVHRFPGATRHVRKRLWLWWGQRTSRMTEAMSTMTSHDKTVTSWTRQWLREGPARRQRPRQRPEGGSTTAHYR